MTETLILAAPIAAAIHLIRTRREAIAGIWREARWYERAALCLALLPIPGPVDELVGVLVVRRVLHRKGGRS